MGAPSWYGRSKPRTLGLLSACLLLSLAAPTPTGLAADEPPILYPEAAGTTIVHGQGVVGITMRLPEPIRLFEDDLTLVADASTKFAFLGLRTDEVWGFCDFCFPNFVEYYPEINAPRYAFCFGPDEEDVGCTYDQELLELYIVSDGPVTLTIRFANLTGTTVLTASAEVDGILERLPVRGCSPLPDCSMGFSYGGRSRVIGLNGRPAMAAAVGYLFAPRLDPPLEDSAVNPNIRGHEACAYPGFLSGQDRSPDPADHPRGCDQEGNPNPMIFGGGELKGDVNWKAHGEQYLGFSVWSKGFVKENVSGFWGFWLESGMTCPSRDYRDCN